MQPSDQTEVLARVEADLEQEARYLYCIADAGEGISLGEIGIEGNEVYTLPYRDICAVVHNCPAQPYQSDNQEVVRAWVMAHQRVVDTAWERWGTVLPLSFDTIIKDIPGKGAGQNLEAWLEEAYPKLKRELEGLRGKAEYGVQVFWAPRTIAQELAETSPEMRKLDEEMKAKSRGLAYLYRQRLENLIKRQMESKAEECFKDFFGRIRKHACDVRVAKARPMEPDWQMIMNLSCLVDRDRDKALAEELDGINQTEGFRVRFTGPWPPYSFAGSA